ncbi:hypothetical protein [Sphingobacterium sp. SGR-19]|uniref:hypothetical protein n=1 Tax=Sphingobacterium sp. SGR-19 TaxID=2710886 RepID=UPI0013EC31CE|nr:hypothetical protein [Sphingobacterium sp. SGR-19]NGM65450.1 hypothetical protein [Sphingobacterium sp. SGR-19]
MKDIEIKLASANDAIKIEPIFSLYREFYGMGKDSSGTIDFLRERLEGNESILLYAPSTCVDFIKTLFGCYSHVVRKITGILPVNYRVCTVRNTVNPR